MKRELKLRLSAISLSFLISALLMAIKFYAYHLTHSSAILSDALESILNVVASGFAIGSIWLSAQPADEAHPYGHGKIEYFSAGFEGLLIFLAAIGIFKTGLDHLISPQELPHLKEGLLLLTLTAVVNLLLGIGLLRVGRKTRSLPLVADGQHVLTDVYSSGGMLLGLALIEISNLYWIDGLLAILLGGNILVSGIKLMKQAIAGLMNERDDALLAEIADILASHRSDTRINVHALRAWRSGDELNIDFHLTMPQYLSLEEGHREIKEVESHLQSHFAEHTTVLIHMDPCKPSNCKLCEMKTCPIRSDATHYPLPEWSFKFLVQPGK